METPTYDISKILHNHGYELGECIGGGAYGECYKITNQMFPDKKFVCKVSKVFTDETKRQKVIASFQNEVNAMSRLSHPNIVNFYDYFQEGPIMFVVMEDCTFGNCYDILKRNQSFMKQNILKFSKELIEAVAFCESFNVAHLDIKPSNLFVDDHGRLKLGDFGLSKVYLTPTTCSLNDFDTDNQDSKIMMERKGSFLYMAPELFKNNPVDPFKVDIWAVGVTIYHMATSTIPWLGFDMTSALRAMENGIRTIPPSVPDELKKIIKMCTQVDPNARPSASALLSFFNSMQKSTSIHKLGNFTKTNPLFKSIHHATKSHGSLNLIQMASRQRNSSKPGTTRQLSVPAES